MRPSTQQAAGNGASGDPWADVFIGQDSDAVTATAAPPKGVMDRDPVIG
jgi:hypothetical protein